MTLEAMAALWMAVTPLQLPRRQTDAWGRGGTCWGCTKSRLTAGFEQKRSPDLNLVATPQMQVVNFRSACC